MCHHHLTSTDICKNVMELLDKLTDAELLGMEHAQSPDWYSPDALLTALPATPSTSDG